MYVTCAIMHGKECMTINCKNAGFMTLANLCTSKLCIYVASYVVISWHLNPPSGNLKKQNQK